MKRAYGFFMTPSEDFSAEFAVQNQEQEREFLQRTIDFIHYLGDEMEMGRLPARDTVDAVRMIAGLLSLQRELI